MGGAQTIFVKNAANLMTPGLLRMIAVVEAENMSFFNNQPKR